MTDSTATSFINSLRKKFSSEFPERQDVLSKQLNSVNSGDCECERHALVKRQIDILKILGLAEIEDLNKKFEQAEQFYKESHDLTALNKLLVEIKNISCSSVLNEEILSHVDSVEKVISSELNCHIYLLLDKFKEECLESVLTAKGYSVTCLSRSDLSSTTIQGVFVVEDNYSAFPEDPFNIIDEVRQNKMSQTEIVLISKDADFEKRLRSVRNNIVLAHETHSDCGLVIRTIDQLVQKRCISNKRVLLICSDSVLSEYISRTLQLEGLSVVIFKSINDKELKIIENESFDMIMIDYFVDDVYGYEISQVIRRYEHFIYVPILFMCSKVKLKCSVHPEMISRYGHMMDQYDQESIIGSVIGTIKNSMDTYKLGKYMSDSLRESQNRRIALDAHCIVSMSDVSGEITEVNDKFCEISGYERQELIGKKHNIVNSGYHPKEYFEDMWDLISDGKIWHGEICNSKKNGELYWVESTIVPFLNEIGKPYQYVSIRTDVTRIKQTEDKLRLSEERLLRSQSFANIGTWDWNIVTGDLYWSPTIASLFGYQEGELETTYDNFLQAVHEDDRDLVINAVNNCVEKGEEYDIEHRCVWPDGSVKWMLERGDVVRSEDGKPLHMLGVVQDITARKNTEIELDKQKRLLEFLKDGLTSFVDEDDFLFVAESILGELMRITQSEYGFTGEVIYDGLDPYVKIHAANNLKWDDKTVDLYHYKCKEGLEVHDLDNLIGDVVLKKKVVICNDVKKDSSGKSMPKSHLDLKNFIGVPIIYGDRLVGVYGLANRDDDYDQQDVDFLKPFNATYSAIIHAKYMADIQKETLELVQKSKAQAVQANQAKSQFLASMSHELRTPMNAILGFGQLLEMEIGQPLNEGQRDNVQEILKAGNHLLELINEILDLSRIEAGKIDLNIEQVELAALVKDSVSIIKSQLEKSEVSIEFSVEGRACDFSDFELANLAVYADPVRLKQVLINLLSNAIKYNRQNGRVYIDTEILDDERLRLTVKDTGVGIPQEKQNELFMSFHRLGAEKTEVEGTGIGLVITKQIVELMGGSIGFESEENIGSTFWVDLMCGDKTKCEESKKDSHANSMDNTSTHKNVIYIEDNPANMRLVTQLMSSFEKINLHTAHESELGMALINKTEPDLILLDINLPGLSGVEIAAMLKSNVKTENVPLIAISANAMESDIDNARSAGFNEYITKPINVPEFIEVLGKYLA